MKLNIVIIGLSITPSWGNGHATTYRALVKALVQRGHDVLFLEQDAPWYAAHRDMPNPPFGLTRLYRDVDGLKTKYGEAVRRADLVVVGSYVNEGIAVGDWVTRVASSAAAFYDIDTPATVAALESRECPYLSIPLVSRYDLYLSFTGGPILDRLEREYGAPRARALYCSVDPAIHFPAPGAARWRLGYLGTYASDRHAALESLLLEPARVSPDERFVVCGALYPKALDWPSNVEQIEHLPPDRHRHFFASQDWTLNITRADMVKAGYAPSVRLFEAAACGVPIVSDDWDGLDEFFEPGSEIVVVSSAEEVVDVLRGLGDDERRSIAVAANRRVLGAHTAAHRALELERYVAETLDARLLMSPVRMGPAA